MKLFYKTLLVLDALALGFIICVSAEEPERPEPVRRQTQTVVCTDSYEQEVPPKPKSRLVRMKVTAYCICEKCCGTWSKYARTATGDDARVCDGVAADPKLLPYRTRLIIPGIGEKEVDDTGGAMRSDARKGIYHIDIRMATHKQALKWGVQWLDVTVLG